MSSVIMFEEMNESLEVSKEFNASIVITELLAKTLENCAKDLALRCIKECALRYGFDADEAISVLGLSNVNLIRKPMTKKSVTKSETKKTKEPKTKKSVFPLPFIASAVDYNKCNGLTYNRGLFTQCQKEKIENSSYCKTCQNSSNNSASGVPSCGTLDQRLGSGLYDFKDPKGRSPIRYTKVLEKLNLTIEKAVEEAEKLSINIDQEHFMVVEKKSKGVSRGRPKKAVVEADNVSDLFAKLTATGEESKEEAPKPKKGKLTEEEKEAKKKALEEERAQKKKERELQAAIAKEEREIKRKEEAAKKKEEREIKKAADKAAKEAEKAVKSKKSVVPTTDVPVDVPVPVPADVPASPKKIAVTRIQISGKQYLKSKSGDNVLYNPETREEIGIWDPETKTIKPLPENEEEEEIDEKENEEEEYDYEN